MATQTLYGLFPTVLDAERAIGALTDHGIRQENIRVVARTPAEEIESARVRRVYTRASDDLDQAESASLNGTSASDPGPTLSGPGLRDAQYLPGEQTVQQSDRENPEFLPGYGVANGDNQNTGVSYHTDATVPAAGIVRSTIHPIDSSDTANNVEAVGKEGITTTTAGDASAGAAIGLGVGLVTGIVATALAVSGVGLVGALLAAGVAATVATAAAGAVAGGVVGYMVDMGMPQAAAERLADRVREGDYLISVVIDTSQYDEVERILNKYNAVGVDDENSIGNRNVQAGFTIPATDGHLVEAGSPYAVVTTTDSERGLAADSEPPRPNNGEPEPRRWETLDREQTLV